MNILTENHIDAHCSNLSISRENLTEFTIPVSVTEIGDAAFHGCTSLKSIDIPDGVTEIDEEAFKECTSLKRISCNNPDLFTNDNIDNKDQITFIPIGHQAISVFSNPTDHVNLSMPSKEVVLKP